MKGIQNITETSPGLYSFGITSRQLDDEYAMTQRAVAGFAKLYEVWFQVKAKLH